MARKSTGGVVEKDTRRGRSYGIRFRALGKRQYQHVGYERDGVTLEQAERELAYVLEQVRRGEWTPAADEPEPQREVPTFHVFASQWLADRRNELRPATLAAYEWELTNHLLPVFARKRLHEITVEDVDRYRRRKVAEGTLGATSINKTIQRLAQVLEDAREYGLIESNPAKGRKRKLKAAKPRRPSLEPWQVVALLDAARELDREDALALPIRRPLLATLAWAGLRIGEAIDLRWRDVDLAGGTIRVEHSKTEAGVREVDVQPELREELLSWRVATPFAGKDDRVFPTRQGGAQNRHNARQRIVLRTVDRANVRLEAAGRPPLPEGLSPHALRRSFASWLIAESEDPAYVMAQMGHTDPSMTLGLYAKAVRNGRRSARSRRRLEELEWAPTGTSAPAGTGEAVAELAA